MTYIPRQVRVFMDVNCGHTICDIHESHNARLYGEYYENAGRPRYNFIRFSACFGREEFKDLDRDAMLKVLDDHASMIHTRHGYRIFRSARKVVADGVMQSKTFRERKPQMRSQLTPPPEPAVYTDEHGSPYVSVGTLDPGTSWHSIRTITGRDTTWSWSFDLSEVAIPSPEYISMHTRDPGAASWEDSLIAPEIAWDPVPEEESPF